MVSHSKLKSILLDKDWAAKWGYTCYSGDRKPFYLSSKCVYRPDVVWISKRGVRYVVEIPMTEDVRAVVGEFFLAYRMEASHFDVMLNEGAKAVKLKYYLREAWKTLLQLTKSEDNISNSPMWEPNVIGIPRRLGNDKKRIQNFLDVAWSD